MPIFKSDVLKLFETFLAAALIIKKNGYNPILDIHNYNCTCPWNYAVDLSHTSCFPDDAQIISSYKTDFYTLYVYYHRNTINIRYEHESNNNGA